MLRFLIIRISLIAVTLLAVSMAIFALIELVPGDAAQVMLGQQATPESLRGLREQMGLDRPPHIRYLDWIWNAVQGDLGVSAKSPDISISTVIGGRLANSALLAIGAFAIAVPSALAAGVWVGTRVDTKIDRFMTMGSLITISLPEFVTGVIMILVLSSTLGWLPSSSIMISLPAIRWPWH